MKKNNKLNGLWYALVIVLILVIGGGAYYFLSKNNSENLENNYTDNSKQEDKFSLKYKGREIVPGTEFVEGDISENATISEIKSCAFEGMDKIYTYENLEIIVSEINNKNTVYSVYFLDESLETGEGVKISDSKDIMIEKYGNEYVESLGNKCTYTKNNVELSFVVENEIITGIEYNLQIN